MEMQEPTVFVVDDDAGVRESMQTLMHASGFAVQCYDSAETFLGSFDGRSRGCVVLDIKMPGMNGVEMLKQLRDQMWHIPVIMVTAHGNIPICVDSMKHGAVDFFEKPYHPKSLLDSVREAIRLDEESWEERHAKQERAEKLARLTDDEAHVLRGIADGKLLKTIASELDVSLRTIQFRRTSIMEKLGVANRAQLVQIASSNWQEE